MIFYTDLKNTEIAGDALQNKRYARIAYQTLDGTITSSGDAAGYQASNVQVEATYNKWIADANTASIELDMGSPVGVDSISLNSAKLDGTYTFEYWNGAAWVVIDGQADLVLTTNEPLLYNFVSVVTDKIKITITSTAPPEIINLYVGKVLVMQRAIYGGHTPITLGRDTVNRPVMSAGGQMLGSSMIRKGVSTSFNWENLTADWYRSTFDPFANEARGAKPFFIAWNSEKFPLEIGYGWTNEDLRPSNTGGGTDFMTVSMNVNGVDYRE